ncbi:DUF2635 domain-containing protein [Chitinibacteraceae bacterium HSL-7]
MFVKPVGDLVVPDPERGGVLPLSGAEVPETQYWLRRIEAGEVDVIQPKKGAK